MSAFKAYFRAVSLVIRPFYIIPEGSVHRTHLLLTGRGDHAFDLVYFIVADHIADGRSQAHDLENRNVASVHIRDQLLGDHS